MTSTKKRRSIHNTTAYSYCTPFATVPCKLDGLKTDQQLYQEFPTFDSCNEIPTFHRADFCLSFPSSRPSPCSYRMCNRRTSFAFILSWPRLPSCWLPLRNEPFTQHLLFSFFDHRSRLPGAISQQQCQEEALPFSARTKRSVSSSSSTRSRPRTRTCCGIRPRKMRFSSTRSTFRSTAI